MADRGNSEVEATLAATSVSEVLHGDRPWQNMHVCSVKSQHGDIEFLQRSGL